MTTIQTRLAATLAATLPMMVAACGAEADPTPANTANAGDTAGALTLGPPVIIRPPASCGLHVRYFPPAFDFDGRNPQNWQTDGIYHGDGSGQAIVAVSTAPWMDETNYPNASNGDPVDGHGSIFFVSDATYGMRESSGFWYTDFVSPELGEDWQFYRQFRYGVLDEFSTTNPPLFAQMILKVQKCDGTVTSYSEVDTAGKRVFCQLRQDHAWTDCQTRISLPGDVDKILNTSVRVFVPAANVYEGAVFLDRIRPF